MSIEPELIFKSLEDIFLEASKKQSNIYIENVLKRTINNPEYSENIKKLDTLDTINLEELFKLKKFFIELGRDYTMNGYVLPIFKKEIDIICKEIEQKQDPIFDMPLLIPADNIIHGYNIKNYLNMNVSCEIFYENIEYWQDENKLTFEEFYELFENTSCTDWCKMDRFGNSFGGYWEYPENSYERVNAFTLSRKDNGLALYELPYPKKFILETIKIGCSNRLECVPFTVYMCEWMEQIVNRINEP